MQQHRIISLLSILLMLVIPVIGWFLVAQPQINAAGTADAQRAEIEAANVASAAVVAQLKVDAANLPKLNDELDELRASIPADSDPSGYIDGLNAMASIAGVSITQLTVEDAQAYVAATPPVPAGGAPAPAEGDAAEGSTDGSTDGTTEEPAPPVVTPGIVTDPLIDPTTFVAIPVTIEVSGIQSSILDFVQALQSKDRLFLVTTYATEPGADPASGILTAKIAGYIWAIPGGVPGDPHPVSTIVKSMTPPEPVVVDEEADGADGADGATPDPENTPTP